MKYILVRFFNDGDLVDCLGVYTNIMEAIGEAYSEICDEIEDYLNEFDPGEKKNEAERKTYISRTIRSGYGGWYINYSSRPPQINTIYILEYEEERED